MSSTLENQATPAAPALPTPPTPTNFRLPGPTQVPPEVAAAGAWPMINHRSPEFNAIVDRVTTGLKYFFQTENDVLCFPGSGSSGWEATVANCFSPGDQVAVISIGNFGERFALVARAFGLAVEMIEFEWGQAADPDVVAHRLRALPNVRGVFVTHNETSTGVMNDLAALSQAIRSVAPDALISVDAVSSLGCVSLPIDQLDLDIVFTGSQKGWMCPPGLMMISAGPRAFEACQTAKNPRFYWDLQIARKSFAGGGPPYTPPVSIWYQLDVALAMMRAEGREQVFARHAAIVKHTHQRLQQMGLTLFADPNHYSHTVTAVNVPEGVDISALLKTLKLEDRVVFQGGQAKLTGKIFRIGHMGYITIADIDAALDALQRRLQK
jgi:aspartate aminotransferase-like enzyme